MLESSYGGESGSEISEIRETSYKIPINRNIR